MRHGFVLGAALVLAHAFSVTAHASDWSGVRYLPQTQLTDGSETTPVADPVYKKIYNTVDRAQVMQHLKELSGQTPVTVGGDTYSITDRYLPESKAKFRAYWTQYFTNLGIPVQEFAYRTRHSIGEENGHNLEAVLPGKSKDSIVVIVHYDSIGPAGSEAQNPGVDDDMTGMAITLETARILASPEYRGHLKYTVRFVAADYEEHASPGLEGAREYAKYIRELARTQGFNIVAAVDNEQTGWNCLKDGACDGGTVAPTVDDFSCSGDFNNYSYSAMGDAFAATVQTYSKLKVSRGCIGENSDHYAMWEIGVPAVVFSEHNPFSNDHFDQSGGDTLDRIDQDYFFSIAQVGVTFAAQLVTLQ